MKNKILLRLKSVLILPLVFLLFTAMSMTGQTQTLSINKLDYSPGEMVEITGTGWIGDDVVILQVFNETFPSLNYTAHYADWKVYPDPVTGNFSSTWDVTDEELNTSLVLTADGQVSGFKYKIFFTDGTRTLNSVSVGVQNETVTFGSVGNPTFLITANTTATGGGTSNLNGITLSASNLPSGVTVTSFTPAAVNANNGTENPTSVLKLLVPNNINAGSYDFTVTASGGNGVNARTVTGTGILVIDKATSTTVVAILGGPFTYTGSAITPASVSVTGAGGLNLTPTATYANNINAGTATAGYTYAGDANHEASSDSKTFSIGKAVLTVTANPQTKIYGEVNPELTIQYSGFVNGDDADDLTTKPTASTEAIDCSPVGNYAITAVGGVDDNYEFSYVDGTLTVNPKVASVTAVAAGKTYGDENPVFTATEVGEVVGCDQLNYTLTTDAVKCSNIGDYTITVNLGSNPNYTVTPTNGTLTVNPKVASVTAVNKTKPYGEDNPALTVTVVGEVASCAIINYTLATTAVKLSPVGDYPITVTLGSNPNYDLSKTDGTLTVTKASTNLVLTLSGSQVRYMDNVTFTAVVTPLNTATPITGSVNFVINGVTYNAVVAPIPGSPDGSVQAMVIMQLPATVNPNTYTVTATFASTNTNYSNSNTDSKTLRVDPRTATPYAATGFYTGDGFAWTTGSSTSTATLTMTAAIKDVNSPTGDVRGAKVSFYFVNGTSLTAIPSAQNLPVGLVDVTNGSVGTASAIVQLNIGSANAASFQIAIKVTGAYTNNPADAYSQTIVTVSKPVAGGYIMGGSNMSNSNSSGYIKGASGLNTDYEFDIQYTKSGTNPKGKVKIMVRSFYTKAGILDSKIHTYIITTNAISLLNVAAGATGTFSAKANLVEQLDDFSTVAIEGGATFQMVAFQNACNQQIAITLYRNAGGVWFSSNWDAVASKSKLQQVNAGSTVWVAGGGSCTATAPAVAPTSKAASIVDPTITESKFETWPNPFTEKVYFSFTSPADTHARLEIYSITGAKLATVFDAQIQAGRRYEAGYVPNLVSSQMVIYRLTMNGETQVGKLIYQERR